jgi:hypothetical protein
VLVGTGSRVGALWSWVGALCPCAGVAGTLDAILDDAGEDAGWPCSPSAPAGRAPEPEATPMTCWPGAVFGPVVVGWTAGVSC